MVNFALKNKLAVVTGGTRGIGLAIANKLSALGAEVIVTGTKPRQASEQLYRYAAVDFSDQSALQQFATDLSRYQPDILINNAGINVINSFEEIALDDFMNIHQVNVVAPFVLCRAVLAGMKAKQWGRIINISSIFGKVSRVKRASYSASKFAIDGMTAALAAEVAQYGILANCVAPGFVETDLTKKILGQEGMAEIAKQIPARRLGKPEEIAALVAWLASSENTYLSGQNIIIDGGFTRV